MDHSDYIVMKTRRIFFATLPQVMIQARSQREVRGVI